MALRTEASSGIRALCFGAAAILILLSGQAGANEQPSVTTRSGPHAQLSVTSLERHDGAWRVRGQLRLLPDPLRHSRPGRLLLEAVSNGRVLAQSEATTYRVVTANRRARQFGYRASLPAELPAGAILRVRHLPASP